MIAMKPISYTIRIFNFPHISMIPSSQVNEFGIYIPPEKLHDRITNMWKFRKPRLIGDISECMAMEIIDSGKICIDQESWNLTCEPLQDIAQKYDWTWKPKYGIRCDDIGAIAVNRTEKMFFIIECKGTIRKTGISRDMEAKMFYQIARTFEKMDRTIKEDCTMKLGGYISIVINHYSKIITMNVNDRNSSFAGGLPDPWMYPEKSIDPF
jgi:hypothetical protein